MPLINYLKIGSFWVHQEAISEVKLLGWHAQVGGIVTGLRHEHAVGAQSHPIADCHSLQNDTGHSQQIIVTDGDTTREMRRRHEPVEVANHIVVPHNHVVVDEIEIAYRDIA